MGKPEHYSADLPVRCLRLLDELYPCASQIFMPDQNKKHGSLTATFALTMAIPIVTLPFERIFKPTDNSFHYADDRQIRENLTDTVMQQMNLGKLSKAQFYSRNVWSFMSVEEEDLFNIAEDFPRPIAEELSDGSAVTRAANMPVSQWIACLRNALAHGGIVYLDENGRSTHGSPVQMFAFVSGNYKYPKGKPRVLTKMNILRIRQSDFIEFLHNWVLWLQTSGLELDAAA